MPLNALIPAIVSSIVGSAAEEIANAPGPASGAGTVAMAPPRLLPHDSLKGVLTMRGPMAVEIDGKSYYLSPGAQMRDPFNMTVLPGMIPNATELPVRYQLDPVGNVYRIWILSAQEAAQP